MSYPERTDWRSGALHFSIGTALHFSFGKHMKRAEVSGVLVKLDSEGMALVVEGEPDRLYPARAGMVRDVTGAGDMVLAVMGLCRGEGVDWGQAADLASVAAGLEVGRSGAAPVTREELRLALAGCRTTGNKLVTLEELVRLAEKYRGQQQRVVLTNGCFDLLHAGHAAYLEEAARLGEVLVVAVNDDAGVKRLKGETRPVVGQDDRAALVAALGCVDHVVLFAEETPHELLRKVRPDVLVKGGDYRLEDVVGKEVVLGYGGQVQVVARRKGLSSTSVMAAVRRRAAGA
jgi:D-beta-D-heptose 7-phosphate kinase/D-beta-D-heptose 1-phosphate adenosyltransferase